MQQPAAEIKILTTLTHQLVTGAPGLAARHPQRHRGLEEDLDQEVLGRAGREHGGVWRGVSRQGQGPGHAPDLTEPVELISSLLANSRGRGAEQSVDDEVRDTGEVVESRDEVLTQRQTGDEQLEGLAGDLTVYGGDVSLLGAEAGMEGEISCAIVTPCASAGPRARVSAVAANINSLRSRGGSDTNLKRYSG